MQAKTKGVFVAEGPGNSQKTAAHQSPQPQRQKHTKIASQPRLNCMVAQKGHRFLAKM